MTRVEWTRIDGNDVEAVIAMFVNREQPNSVRITPSRGDGGVDILDRGSGSDGSDVVYQVKGYTEPLTSKQKKEVEKSLSALVQDERWRYLNVEQWYLVTLWDPTPEALLWLDKLTLSYEFKAEWKGLTYADQLAAKYSDVVDYYLHGGKSRVEDAYRSVSAFFSLDHDADSASVPEIAEKVKAALSVLESDPHYRYEFRFGQGEVPDPGSRSGLVMSWIAGENNGGSWVIVDVIARCAAAVDERPIIVRGHVKFQQGSPHEKNFLDFLNYGTPFADPLGTYQGEVDAPGGLGGPVDGAAISSYPANEALSEDSELHFEVLDPHGTVLESVDIDRVDRTFGVEGIRVVFEERNKIFSIEDRHNLSAGTGRRKLWLGELGGKPVISIKQSLALISQCRSPNVGRFSVRNTPPRRGVIDANINFNCSRETENKLNDLISWVDTLVLLQEYSRAVIRFPGNGAPSANQLERWRFAEKILREGELEFCYPEGKYIGVVLDSSEGTPEDSFSVRMPLQVNVGGQQFDLGNVEVCLEGPTLINVQEREGKNIFQFETPNRKIRYVYLGA